MKTALFDFMLPADRIATQPASPRDASRMLVIKPESVVDDKVLNLLAYIKPGDVMVFNDTKVIPARLSGKRGNAAIEIMLIKAISSTTWQAFAKPASKLKVNDNVIFADSFFATITAKKQNGTVELLFNTNKVIEQLHCYGKLPLPPYMKRKSQASDNADYQTVYAKKDGAVAAPTAGLHFTNNLLESIDKLDIKRIYVTLHVGAGTFQPVKTEDTINHVMHSEYAEISDSNAEILNQCRKNGGRIIAVGTTSLRVLETATKPHGFIEPYAGETDIFITPGYQFKAVDILVTNFHLPKSTLFMLVSAFMGLEQMQKAYAHAIEQNYRFYSYGDACLLIR